METSPWFVLTAEVDESKNCDKMQGYWYAPIMNAGQQTKPRDAEVLSVRLAKTKSNSDMNTAPNGRSTASLVKLSIRYADSK